MVLYPDAESISGEELRLFARIIMAFDKTARDLSWPKGTPCGDLANDLYGRMKAMAASGYSDARVFCEAGVEKKDDGITISLNMEGYFGVTCKDAMDCVRLRAPRLLPLFEKAYSLFSAIFVNGKDLQIQASDFFSDVIEPELTNENYCDEEEAKSLAERYAAIKGLQYPEGLFYGCRGGFGKKKNAFLKELDSKRARNADEADIIKGMRSLAEALLLYRRGMAAMFREPDEYDEYMQFGELFFALYDYDVVLEYCDEIVQDRFNSGGSGYLAAYMDFNFSDPDGEIRRKAEEIKKLSSFHNSMRSFAEFVRSLEAPSATQEKEASEGQ